ncbi:TPA: ABC transporter ATP-binding protein [Candidatus Latescibacteria bacterium]|nr:ABC transporter ATP-binding protein [Candidatus Latescibacterota bacterium]
MRSISKRFGHITALTEIDLDLYEGEVLALLGDNGAGKSTLIKVLTGVCAPSSGEIHFEGRSVSLTSPSVARDLGIETVYQDLALIPRMSIARNFYLGRELTKQVGPFRVLDHDAMNRGATEALREIGIDIRDTDEPVGSLSGGERQSIAIGRAVHFGSQVLILDEPTSALSIGETRKVLGYIASARERGMSVIFITHNLQHVFEVADRLAVLANGTKVGDFQRDEVTEAQVAEMITS